MTKNNDNIYELVSSVEEKIKVASVVKRLLQLEKELSVPGAQLSDEDRVARVMDVIERESF
jgi:hypothetical protein